MPWIFAADRPIYLQLVEHIQMKIISGEYQPGDRLPSVRELAAEAAVNPNTMQKAMSELERSGLVYSQRTSGRFITENELLITNLRHKTALEQTDEFLSRMQTLGFSAEETLALLQEQLNKQN
jgi:DNA-binding transcriptional regulator YhcF (GntR family)